MTTNDYGTSVEKIRQDKVYDIFKATYKGMEAYYKFPRTMDMKEIDIFDVIKPEDFS